MNLIPGDRHVVVFVVVIDECNYWVLKVGQLIIYGIFTFVLLPESIDPEAEPVVEAEPRVLAKPYSAQSESAVKESAKMYPAKPYSDKPTSGIC